MRLNHKSISVQLSSIVCLFFFGFILIAGCSKAEPKKRSETTTENVVTDMTIPPNKGDNGDAPATDMKKKDEGSSVGTLPFDAEPDKANNEDSAAPGLNAPG